MKCFSPFFGGAHFIYLLIKGRPQFLFNFACASIFFFFAGIGSFVPNPKFDVGPGTELPILSRPNFFLKKTFPIYIYILIIRKN